MVDATPSAGAPADDAGTFQSLYDSGAFSSDGKTVPDDAERRPQAPTPEPAAAAPEPADATGAQPAAAQPAGEPEEAPQSWESLDKFIEDHQLDPEQFKAIPVAVKIDGETKTVPLSDVIKSYQLEGHVNNKSMELSNARRQFEQEQEQTRASIRAQVERNEVLGNLAMQQLNVDFQRVNWQELRATDPGQYAALFADFQQRQNAIGQYMANVQQSKQADQQRQQNELAQRGQKELQQLVEMRPTWRDPAVFTKDRDQFTAYAKNYGFTDAELNSIVDHRFLLILDEAARYRALQASKPAATKLVREAPQMAKPGTRTSRDPAQVARQNALERLGRNPRDIDSQAAYFETLT